MIGIFGIAKESTSPRWCDAFYQGCPEPKKIYFDVNELSQDVSTFAMFGSPKLWKLFTLAKEKNIPWIYVDKGHFKRGEYYRTTRNNIMTDGTTGSSNSNRFESLGIPIHSWRISGEHILVCPPGKQHALLHGFDNLKWLKDTSELIQKYTDRQIKVRWKQDARTIPLSDALKDCWALVTCRSNAAVEAILMGIPAFGTHFSPVWGMNPLGIETIETPHLHSGRYEWACRLANNQWNFEEMRSGQCWNELVCA